MYCEMYNQVNTVKYLHTPLFGNSALRKQDPHELWRRVLLAVEACIMCCGKIICILIDNIYYVTVT